MRFPSRVDIWLAVLVWSTMLGTIGVGIIALFQLEGQIFGAIVLLLVTVGLPCFLLWMWIKTYYVIEAPHLIIHFGPFKKKILLESITKVKKMTSPYSGPALSLRKIEIYYNRFDFIYISPKNRDEFISILKKYCPHIKIEDSE